MMIGLQILAEKIQSLRHSVWNSLKSKGMRDL